MSTLAILQARMTSTRLPGKVLAPVLGEPMILRQIERVRGATRLSGLVVATSEDRSDDPLVEVLVSHDVSVVRGSLDDVLSRFLVVIDEFEPDVVVRLTADCPLASPIVIDRVVSGFEAGEHDYVSNTLAPTFPDGLDVEVVTPDALRWVAAHSEDPYEREHATLGVYRHPEHFRLGNVTNDADLSHLRWTVDEPADLDFVRVVYERLHHDKPEFDMEDICALLDREPGLSRTSAHASRNGALDGLDTGAMIHNLNH